MACFFATLITRILMKKSITAAYAGAQGLHWAAYCGVISLAGIYLQAKGFDTAQVGFVLALATIAPALIQPFLAASADRSARLSLRAYLTILSVLAISCSLLLFLFDLPDFVVLSVFLLASVLIHLLEPLLNSIASYSFRNGIPLDFGISRSMGSIAFAFTSLGLGYAAKHLGGDSIVLFSGLLTALFLVCLFLLPKMPPEGSAGKESETAIKSCSVAQFLIRYPRYVWTMVGFFFIAAFHVMTETYLINMMERIGGDSSHVGVAMLVANASEFIVIFFFERIRKLLSSGKWLIVAAFFFAVKALLFHLAPSVPMMYLAQALESVTYGIYAPSIVHFADEEIAPADSVKGQSIWIAIFTLGGSLGNYAGGFIIKAASVRAMTFSGFLFCALGALIVTVVQLNRKHAKA